MASIFCAVDLLNVFFFAGINLEKGRLRLDLTKPNQVTSR